MNYFSGIEIRRRVGLLAGCVAAAQFAWLVHGQVQVLVSYEDEMLPVVSMSGATPVVEVQGERLMVPDPRVRVEKAPAYTDGAIEVVERNAVMGQDYGSPLGGSFFRFVATVRAERDFEDCYILFVITPEMGEDTYMLREISDINSTGMERILLTLPVNPGFGGGAFGYRIFSRGQEIRRYEPDDPILVDGMGAEGAGQGERASRRPPSGQGAVEPAKVLEARLLEFPESLVGKNGGGYATAIYSVGQDGRVIEILDVAADYADFLPEVWKTVTQTRYAAGTYEGEPLVTTVRQSFFFNEFAPFSEALEMIPYPEMPDRDAKPLYAPLPQVEGRAATEVKLELLVDTLGRARSLQIAEGGGGLSAAQWRRVVDEWVFLPAVVDGYPAEQTVVIPISFGVKE